MHDSSGTTSTPGDSPLDPSFQTDVLIGRIIDAEAGLPDRQRFEKLAEADPSLWRTLALRQQDMIALKSRFDRELSNAERVELPDRAPDGHIQQANMPAHGRTSWALALSGWAAVLVVGLIWSITNQPTDKRGDLANTAMPASRTPPALSHDEHLRQYLTAPFVLGELPPTMLQVEEISDGRIAIRFLRRIEEVAFIPAGESVPVDEKGDLTKSPAELRQSSSSTTPAN